MAIEKTTLHPQGNPDTDLYPKTSVDQVEGLQDIDERLTELVNNKLDKSDVDGDVIYAHAGTEDIMIMYSKTSVGNAIAQYNSDGNLIVNTPTSSSAAVPLSFLNSNYIAKPRDSSEYIRAVCQLANNNISAYINVSANVVSDSMVFRTSSGQVRGARAAANEDLVPLSQVTELAGKYQYNISISGITIDGLSTSIQFKFYSSLNTLNSSNIFAHLMSHPFSLLNTIMYCSDIGILYMSYVEADNSAQILRTVIKTGQNIQYYLDIDINSTINVLVYPI